MTREVQARFCPRHHLFHKNTRDRIFTELGIVPLTTALHNVCVCSMSHQPSRDEFLWVVDLLRPSRVGALAMTYHSISLLYPERGHHNTENPDFRVKF